MKRHLLYLSTLILLSTGLTSCSDNVFDEEWLEKKRDRSLVVPSTLQDMRRLLTDESTTARDNIAMAALSDDDFYIPDVVYPTRTERARNIYIWKEEDPYAGTDDDSEGIPAWDESYDQVLVANVVLEGLESISRTPANGQEWDDVKGGALYLRARAFYNLAQMFAKPYIASSAASDPGIPLRTSPDLNTPVTRSSVEETYERITADLEEAAGLLRETPEFIMDASRPAALGLLARCYLSMSNYEKAHEYADLYLESHSDLMDFNTLVPSASYPIPEYNEEVIQHTTVFPDYLELTWFYSRVGDALYNSYDDDDLRKTAYFRDRGDGYSFWGSYSGGLRMFSGIATDEMYLVRAECNARLNNVSDAMDDLNTLLETRWVTGTYEDMTAANANEALNIILTERRKELLRRGLRWTDLRRLNQDPVHATTLARTIEGDVYTLPPGDPRYVLPIPEYVIRSSGIEQNSR